MKKIIPTLFVSFSLLFLCSTLTFAHFMVNNNGVGVLIHVDPDDSPVVGEVSHIHLNFQDNAHSITQTNCECTLQIISAGKVLTNIPITVLDSSQHTFMTDYTFSEKGIYTLQVDGTIRGSTPNTFHLTYDLRVDRDDTTGASAVGLPISTGNPQNLIVGGIIVFFVIGVIVYIRSRKS